jgi:Fe-S-cluster-containing dehydrogenase component
MADQPTTPHPMPVSRRKFLAAGAVIGVAAAGGVAVARRLRAIAADPDPTGPGSARELPALDQLPHREQEDVLVRMQQELRKAMAKPAEQRRWVMVIDTRKCVGCDACTVGCVAENKLPPGVVYRPVVKEEVGEFPNVSLRFTPRPCMQCEEPPCVPVCPVKATWRRPDGITTIDYDKCIGCRYCITACPYQARTSDFGETYTASEAVGAGTAPERAVEGGPAPWEALPNFEYAKHWNRHEGFKPSPKGNARKCHFCLHRLEVGQLPMCATTCIGRATYFGDANDPQSLVTELITKHRTKTLLPHLGTKPRVHYIY